MRPEARAFRGVRRALLGLAFTALAAVAHAADLTLAQLMQALSETKSGETRFTEERKVASLDQTLQSSGRLSFTAPDRFVRETLKPRHEKLAVDGNTLIMSRGSSSRTVQLDTVPEAEVMVDAIRGTLTGNAAVLERAFQTTVGGTLDGWQLQLDPKDARLRETIRSIEIRGRKSALLEVRVLLADGDSSVMKIEPPEAAAR
jgi:outer membrane lipoprotein-sorting protein